MWLPPIISHINGALGGLPDMTLSLILTGIGITALLVAWFASPVVKAIVAAWMLAP